MEDRRLKVQNITSDNFKAYGTLVDGDVRKPDFESEEFCFWNTLAVVEHKKTAVCMVEARPSQVLTSSTFEQHSGTTETLIPVDGDVILVLGISKKDDSTKMDLETVRAFLLPAGNAVILNPQVWHFAPLVNNKPTKIFVLFEYATPDTDLAMKHTDEEEGVSFVIDSV